MSAAGFEIEFRPAAGVRALRWAMLGLGLAGMLLAAVIAGGHDKGWYLLGFGALFLWVGWRHGRLGLAWGVLRVEGDGQAHWRDFDGERFIAVQAERWAAGERLIWIRLRADDGRREVLLVRGGASDEQWRRLAGWLTWLRRGRAAA
ncbi:MAG TPA: hypothetical protein PK177_02145 [Burkholderiaceae bacterium]|nr:hypothetical protein [Burkholderiaceae bacterium]